MSAHVVSKARRIRHAQSLNVVLPNGGAKRLVDDPEHGDDVAVLRLADELGEDADVVERALRVRDAHRAVQPADRAELAGVVPAVLRAGDGVQVDIDADAVLACPGDRLKEVRPARVREERLALPDLDRPVRQRDAYKVQAGAGDLRKVLLGDEGLVVVLELREAVVRTQVRG
jgi:hypothetical protein